MKAGTFRVELAVYRVKMIMIEFDANGTSVIIHSNARFKVVGSNPKTHMRGCTKQRSTMTQSPAVQLMLAMITIIFQNFTTVVEIVCCSFFNGINPDTCITQRDSTHVSHRHNSHASPGHVFWAYLSPTFIERMIYLIISSSLNFCDGQNIQIQG